MILHTPAVDYALSRFFSDAWMYSNSHVTRKGQSCEEIPALFPASEEEKGQFRSPNIGEVQTFQIY